MVKGYNKGHIIFGRYLDQSLKDNKTREKRATTETNYDLHVDMKYSMTLKELLSSCTRKQLIAMLAEVFWDVYISEDCFEIYVIYDNKNKIKVEGIEKEHVHEDADTLIDNQVMRSISPERLQYIDVWSPDTDVLILLLDLVAHKQIQTPNLLNFISRNGTKYRQIM